MGEEKEDIILDDGDLDDSVVAEESQSGTIKKLRGKLKAAEEKAKEYLDGWQRTQADMANARKRDAEAQKEFVKFANEGLVSDLIPILDSFEIAIAGGHKDLEPIFAQLLAALKSHGLEALEPEGEEFDPRTSEAIGAVEVPDKKNDHKILEVAQKGYILQGKIIRPAKVKIGQYNG